MWPFPFHWVGSLLGTGSFLGREDYFCLISSTEKRAYSTRSLVYKVLYFRGLLLPLSGFDERRAASTGSGRVLKKWLVSIHTIF